ncbi:MULTISPECIES: hypothetical protein [unclassified Eikenella]|uniref:hypothetical protein n=1 Tax=unclassified Eikenella TaxID=2639367 RepID=UPI000AF5BBBA|nr:MULTISPECIES: hypothetical protein [unclassified Eikenella]
MSEADFCEAKVSSSLFYSRSTTHNEIDTSRLEQLAFQLARAVSGYLKTKEGRTDFSGSPKLQKP